jgi:hydroxyacylglutathione hydrolase
MIKVDRLVFNDFQENTFIISAENGDAIIVDPGCYSAREEENLVNFLKDNELKPVRLINTHGHIDHILGVSFVCERFNLRLELHKGDLPLVKNAPSYGTLWGFEVKELPEVDTSITDKTEITLGDEKLILLPVPGHSPGSIAIYSHENKFVIVGDVLFKGSIGRTDLLGGDYDVLMKSIGTQLMTLDEDVTVHSGHGPSTSIGYEKRSNPFVTEYFSNL